MKISTFQMALLCLLGSFFGYAQNYTTCNQYDYWQIGNGFTIYNNIWGSGAGTQCLWAYDKGNWGVWADHPSSGGIKAYPNVDYDVNYNIGSMPTITSTFGVSVPSSGSYNSAYDIWYNNYAYEVMLWMNYNGSMGPISYNYGCNGYPSSACPIATNVNVGGHTWNVYEGTNGSATVYSFLRTSDTNSGTVNITQISQWLVNNNYFTNSTNLHEIQFGFEITNSPGGADFIVNNYDLNIGSGSGSSSYIKLQNRNTGLFLDGMGRTSNGSDCGQWSSSGSYNQQWEVINSGSYVKLKNRATGLFLDGMGRTSNGSITGQWSESSSYNQQWLRVSAGSYYKYQNRATGLYLDGMGNTTNGANVAQWSSSSHYNQQWAVTTISARPTNTKMKPEEIASLETTKVYPNPLAGNETLTIQLASKRENVGVAIYDTTGKLLSSYTYSTIDKIELNPNLKSGIYFLQLNEDNQISTQKIAIQ